MVTLVRINVRVSFWKLDISHISKGVEWRNGGSDEQVETHRSGRGAPSRAGGAPKWGWMALKKGIPGPMVIYCVQFSFRK